MGGNSIRRLDLTKDGEATLFTVSDKKVKSVRVISMNGMKVDFFRQKKDQVLRNGRGQWKVKIEVNILLRITSFTFYTSNTH